MDVSQAGPQSNRHPIRMSGATLKVPAPLGPAWPNAGRQWVRRTINSAGRLRIRFALQEYAAAPPPGEKQSRKAKPLAM